MLAFLKRAWNYLVPDVDQLGDALPENHEAVKARMQDLEVCRKVAFDALAARNTTRAPLANRRAS